MGQDLQKSKKPVPWKKTWIGSRNNLKSANPPQNEVGAIVF